MPLPLLLSLLLPLLQPPRSPRARTACPPQNTARPQMFVLRSRAYEDQASSCGGRREWGKVWVDVNGTLRLGPLSDPDCAWV